MATEMKPDTRSEDSTSGESLETTAQPGNADAEEREYLSGVKLVVLLGSLTLVTFLVLLDTSIIGTVRRPLFLPLCSCV